MIGGYAVNFVAVPGLALVGSWQAAVLLILLERVGKAVRSPARSTLVSYAAHEAGVGASFGLEEALDQIGAVTGPLRCSMPRPKPRLAPEPPPHFCPVCVGEFVPPHSFFPACR